jgi:hypothetical protein
MWALLRYFDSKHGNVLTVSTHLFTKFPLFS